MTSDTSEKDKCPRCGAVIPADRTETLCPACLMSGALEQTGAEAETLAMGPGESMSLDGPSEFPTEFGGYRLLGMLGRGGMGTVYEAEQMATGRRVALKLLGRQLHSQDMRQRFLREGRLAAGVSHPNSLYVFGTEEIKGVPVIIMEIAASGTLNDLLKKRGPLPVTEAVDAILDVIAGLEAAFVGGVLHRDIKPANCFVSPDRSVKVGDYGLSVSTVPTADTFATATGVIMGTPAYAPPEQLRGRDLDVRADIYSVGATLFTLLTNRPPVEGRNPVEIVAAVLDEKPKSLTELREDMPPGLAQAVARCLAKKPEQRYADYAALRNALLPFSSEKAEPAALGRRTLALLIDYAVFFGIPKFLLTLFTGIDAKPETWLGERAPAQLLSWIGLTLFVTLYFTLAEGIWGAGLGKALLGFRVSRSGGRAPGFGRGLMRATIVILAGNLSTLVALAILSAEEFVAADELFKTVIGILSLLASLSVFATMRRHSGFATLWDLATGTRVVVKAKGAVRPVIDVETAIDHPAPDADSIGPYPIVEEIVPGQWIAARDPALRRQVWLRRRETSKLTPARRDLARPGRLRWLQSVVTPEASWDAFEALPGVAFSSVVHGEKLLHWESLRHWLHDLALEVALAAGDDTLPAELSLDHIWITTRGRAILLDEPWPKTETPADRIRVDNLAGRQRFLLAVAECVHPTTIPLHAQPVLQSLSAGSFEKLSFLAGSFRSLITKRARLDRSGRFASLFAFPLLVIALLVFGLLFTVRANRRQAAQWSATYPDLPPLSVVLNAREDSVEKNRDYSLIDIHIAGHYAHLADSLNDTPLGRKERDTLRKILDAPPQFTGEELEEADRLLSRKSPDLVRTTTSFPIKFVVIFPLVLGGSIALAQLFSLALFRATPGQFLFGFAVVTARGAPAGRLRLLGRWMTAWFPVACAVALLVTDMSDPKYYLPALTILLLWLAALVYTVVSPNRGLHDRVARTWVVPV